MKTRHALLYILTAAAMIGCKAEEQPEYISLSMSS